MKNIIIHLGFLCCTDSSSSSGSFKQCIFFSFSFFIVGYTGCGLRHVFIRQYFSAYLPALALHPRIPTVRLFLTVSVSSSNPLHPVLTRCERRFLYANMDRGFFNTHTHAVTLLPLPFRERNERSSRMGRKRKHVGNYCFTRFTSLETKSLRNIYIKKKEINILAIA